MLSQQELSDRFEIQDLVFHYSHLIDSKQLDRLREDLRLRVEHLAVSHPRLHDIGAHQPPAIGNGYCRVGHL